MSITRCDASSASSAMREALLGLVTAVSLAFVTACASTVERSTYRDLRSVEADLAAMPDPDVEPAPDDIPDLDGQLSSYLAHAFANSPELRASFEEWRAATYEPRQARRLPDPELTFGVFVVPMETPMGPIRAQLSVMQMFPWPTKVSAENKAAAHRAEAAQRRFEADALEIAANVARPYWKLWEVERMREIERDEIAILGDLSEQVRVRIEVGAADLSELARIELRRSRAHDSLAELDERERAFSAELVRAVGAPVGTPTPILTDPPRIGEPAESDEALFRVAAEHPRVTTMVAMSAASSESARAARADRFPRFGLGVEWMIMGQSQMVPPPQHDGRDAVMLMGTVTVPLWQRAYGAAVEGARANEAAFRARALSARNQVMAETQGHLARVSSDVRRIRLYEGTLVSQAETAFESVMASYVAGRSTIGELLMAERELVDLQRQLVELEVEYAIDFAELERTVGRPVPVKEVDRAGR
jgi:outer membrane protein, heavy metal efflux system